MSEELDTTFEEFRELFTKARNGMASKEEIQRVKKLIPILRDLTRLTKPVAKRPRKR